MPFHAVLLAIEFQVPHADCLILACRKHITPVRGEDDASDILLMPGEQMQLSSSGGVPDPHCAVDAARCDLGAVG